MTYRVVIPRSIPLADANRVQREVWRRGYSTRLAGRDTTRPGHQVIEFLRLVEELPEPADVPEMAQELERLLSGERINAAILGRGGWVETVQRPPRKHIA
jgi:hypothetical protein